MNINEAYRYYEADCRIRRVSPDSIKLNQYSLDLLKQFWGSEDIQLEDLNHLGIREFLSWLGEMKSPATVSRVYDVLSALFRFLEREELIDANPVKKASKPKVPPRVITPLTEEDVEKLLSACDTRTFTGLRNSLIVSILFDTGMRATELTDLELEDTDLEANRILIRHGKGDRPRYVYFGQSVAKLLRRYLLKRGDPHTEKLIVTSEGGPTDRHWLKQMIVRLGKRVGVKVYPHLFRHSCGVALLRNGSDVFTVQRLLGHATLQMTRRYSQLADRDVQDKHLLYSPSDRLKSGTSRKHR